MDNEIISVEIRENEAKEAIAWLRMKDPDTPDSNLVEAALILFYRLVKMHPPKT